MNPSRQPTTSSRGRSSRRSCATEAGITLLELLVVLIILTAIAGIAIVSISDGVTVRGNNNENYSPEAVATLGTMQTVREALIGNSVDEPGYLQDLGYLPVRIGFLMKNIDDDNDDVGDEPVYDASTRRGWRGPYLVDAGTRYRAPYIESGDSFPSYPDTDPAILDGWGKPLLLGQQANTVFAWLVSAGENRILETSLTDSDHDTDSDDVPDRGDDIVLFLLTSDPNL